MPFGVLRHYFSDKPWLASLNDVFHEANREAGVGHLEENVPIDKLTPDVYHDIVNHKYFVAVRLPLVAALIFADRTADRGRIEPLAKLIEQLVALNDDETDFFDKEGKVLPSAAGFLKGRVSWPLVKGLAIASPAQKKILKALAKGEGGDVAVLDQLGIHGLLVKRREELVAEIKAGVKKLEKESEVLASCLNLALEKNQVP